MTDRLLEDRRKALEEQFFRKENEKLRQKLQAERTARENREALAELSGIRDEAALTQLLEQGVSAETLAALVLVPLVAVAWADGEIDARERAAILAAAADFGVARGSPNFDLLEGWLSTQPGERLLDTWTDYVSQLGGALVAGGRQVLREELIGRARDVARASGGILGLGTKVSASEQAVLDRLAKALAG
jgi:tellurite resistance protein